MIYDCAKLIHDWKKIEWYDGRQAGKWECECFDYSEEYLRIMKKMADTYGIKYEDKLEDNFDEEYWEKELEKDKYKAMDELGFDLKQAVEEKIRNEIREFMDEHLEGKVMI